VSAKCVHIAISDTADTRYDIGNWRTRL